MNFLKLAVATIALVIGTVAVQAQVTPLNYQGVFTNNITITNGATTLAGTTNRTISINQDRGLGLSFGAYATNTGQLTFYIQLSMDGTNFNDALVPIVWGHTLPASSWIRRSTNIPASVIDNHRYAKVTIVSNSAATVYMTNAVWSRRQ